MQKKEILIEIPRTESFEGGDNCNDPNFSMSSTLAFGDE